MNEFAKEILYNIDVGQNSIMFIVILQEQKHKERLVNPPPLLAAGSNSIKATTLYPSSLSLVSHYALSAPFTQSLFLGAATLR